MTMFPTPIPASGVGASSLPLSRSYEITSGNMALGNNGAGGYSTFASVLTVPVAVGDHLLIGANGAVTGAHADIAEIDVATMTLAAGGTPINWVGGSGGLGANGGISGWLVTEPINQNPTFGPLVPYTVQAGDVVSGNVYLQPYGYVAAAGNRSVLATASNPFWFYCINMRQL